MLSITVRSEKEDRRIPIAVASDVMFDIQLLLTHIGESFICDEFGSYGRPAEALAERFTLYIDPNSGGISFRSSAGKGKSALMDKAGDMLSATLEKMGSGTGTYWMEDSFRKPMYRFMVMDDLIQLSKHMASERGYSLIIGNGEKEFRFSPVNMEKAEAFMIKNARLSSGPVAGILHGIQSKRGPMYGFSVDGARAKISFRSKEAEEGAAKYVNGPVLVTGTFRYSDDGVLLEASDVILIEPFDKKAFRHMISAGADIPLVRPLEAAVSYEHGTTTWTLKYPDLGLSVSDQDWDAAVAGFHDRFVLLYENCSPKDENELSDEERNMKKVLLSFTDGE